MKHLLLLLLLTPSALAKAPLYKILYDLGGVQTLTEVSSSGSVTSDATVLWDEREDGPLPADAPVGHAERVVVGIRPGLRSNAAKLTALRAREKVVSDAEAAKLKDQERLKVLKEKIENKTSTPEEATEALGLFFKLGK